MAAAAMTNSKNEARQDGAGILFFVLTWNRRDEKCVEKPIQIYLEKLSPGWLFITS